MSARSFRRLVTCFALSFACLLSSGCNPLTALYFLFLMPAPKVDAAYAGLEKQTVVVLATVGRGSQFEYAGVDNDIVKWVVRDLRENVKGIKIADPSEVRQWRDEHSGFDLPDAGKAFKATRVVYLEIEEFTLYEQKSSTLYRGKATVRVQVADMEKDGEIVYDNIVEPLYPGNRSIPTSDLSQGKFRAIFVKYLSRQVSHSFFEYRPDEDFSVN